MKTGKTYMVTGFDKNTSNLLRSFGSRTAMSLAGPLTLALIILSLAVVGGYQFVYVPIAGAGPEIDPAWLDPSEEKQVRIVDGSSNIEQEDNFVPKEMTLTLGVDNRVVWLSEDSVLHTITADPGEQPEESFLEHAARANFIDLGQEFIFTFLVPGEYNYHCEPHPWMRGTITVIAPEGAEQPA